MGSLWSSAGLYALTNFFSAAIPFLLMPVFTRYLTPADYGTTATFQVLVSFIAPFIGLSINGAIARKYYDKDIDLPKFIGNCLIILLVSSLLVSLICWLLRTPISHLAVFPSEWFWAVAIVSVGQCISLIVLTVWQVRLKAIYYGAFKIATALLTVGISIWLVVYMGMNWQGSVWAQVLAGIGMGIFGMFILWINGWIKLKFDYSYINAAMKFGIPLIPHALGGWIMLSVDRIFINRMVGLADTGIYAVAFQFAMIITMIQVSFNTAWVPWLYEKLKQNNPHINVKIIKFTYLYIIAMFIFAIALAQVGPWFMGFFVGKNFRAASEFLLWLVLARAFDTIYFMTCNYIFYSTKTSSIAIASFAASIVHITAAYLLIKMNGTIGAAQATLISSLVLAILVWWFATRLHKMPWLLGRLK